MMAKSASFQSRFGFSKSHMKGNAKWHRMIFLGKVECQDSFLLYDGSSLVLTRSVRRVNIDWRMYMQALSATHGALFQSK